MLLDYPTSHIVTYASLNSVSVLIPVIRALRARICEAETERQDMVSKLARLIGRPTGLSLTQSNAMTIVLAMTLGCMGWHEKSASR
jgi:hypothetical protein